MKTSSILQLRLHNQLLTNKIFKTPAEVVNWFGAIQSQDFEGATWAIGQRIKDGTQADILHAFDKGEFIRTHILRPTWHFVSPRDIKWMLKLTAARILKSGATNFRLFELNEKVFRTSNIAMTKALQKGPLARNDLKKILQQKGIRTDEIRFIWLLLRAEVDGLICSGPKIQNQFTYMLLDERAPAAITLNKEESLAELAKRYFQSHGPATVKDFAWWSGLTNTEAKNGIESIKKELLNEKIDDEIFWFSSNTSKVKKNRSPVLFLPAFDEYSVAYKNRQFILHKSAAPQNSLTLLSPSIIYNGYAVGNWKRVITRGNLTITSTPFISFPAELKKKVFSAGNNYAKFMGKNLIKQG